MAIYGQVEFISHSCLPSILKIHDFIISIGCHGLKVLGTNMILGINFIIYSLFLLNFPKVIPHTSSTLGNWQWISDLFHRLPLYNDRDHKLKAVFFFSIQMVDIYLYISQNMLTHFPKHAYTLQITSMTRKELTSPTSNKRKHAYILCKSDMQKRFYIQR